MNPKLRAKLQKQIQNLLRRGYSGQQIYNRLFAVTFGDTTAGQLADLINETQQGFHSKFGKYRQYEPAISKLKSTSALRTYIQELRDRGEITIEQGGEIYQVYRGMISGFNAEREAQEQAEEAQETRRNSILGYASLPGEVKNYLKDFQNPQDLAARIRQLDTLGYGYLDQNAKADLYDSLIEDYNAKETSRMLEQSANYPGSFDVNAWFRPELKRNPTSDEFVEWADVTNKANYAKWLAENPSETPEARMLRGNQRSQAVLNAFQGTFQPQLAQGSSFQPGDIGGLITSFRDRLGSTAGGEGTRLRQFIESGLGEDIEGTLAARQRWVQAMNAPLPEGYSDRMSSLRQQAERNLAISEDLNLTASSIGNVYWGEGGPARIAKEAYERQLKEIEGLNPADFPEPETYKGVDPLKALLEDPDYLKKKRAAYYRLPGVMRQVVAPVRYR